MADGSEQGSQVLRNVDASIPHSARIWNYWLGGKDNFQADRDAGDEFLALYPEQRDKARACRSFLFRAVRHLVVEEGVRQFLDIGTGLPTANNTHEVAQRFAPESKIVYVDNDPLVLAHARALLTSSPEGETNYIDADLHDPDAVLVEAAKTLDFSQPIALLLIGVLGHVGDYDEARSILRRLLDRLPPGSFLVESDGTDTSDAYEAALESYKDNGGEPYNSRTPEQVAGYYEGLELLDPGVVPIGEWRPDEVAFGTPPDVDEMGGVGRKR
jgi:O-methyltransferase involved in polyketide biosynthesis